jgi:hypothetical protein
MAAGTVTFSETIHGTVKKLVATWTSGDAGGDAGNATATTTAVFDGELLGMTTIPGTAGDAPTDNYDITLKDSAGHDVLIGAGKDRDTLNTEHVARASLAGAPCSPLTFLVENAGNAKKGVAIFYLR